MLNFGVQSLYGRNITIGDSESSNHQTELCVWKQEVQINCSNHLFLRCCPWTTGSVDHESVQALEAVQNPRLTASGMTTTQKFDQEQMYASEGAIRFCANSRGLQQLENASPKLSTVARQLLNTPVTNLQKINVRITFIAITWGALRITAASIIIYKL